MHRTLLRVSQSQRECGSIFFNFFFAASVNCSKLSLANMIEAFGLKSAYPTSAGPPASESKSEVWVFIMMFGLPRWQVKK